MDGAILPPPYPAEKLDLHHRQIRLVTLFPGRYIDAISCDLSTVSLDDLPDYNALSYAWGDRADSRDILLNGVAFKVTRNLEASLRRLRHPNNSVFLWIDMLCIDQQSVEERTHQVNLMSLIYSCAVEVFVWLGDYVETALQKDSLSLHNNQGHEDLSHQEAVLALTALQHLSAGHHFDPFRQGTGPRLNKAQVDALGKLVELSWWHRVWTVQEVILPSKVTVVVGWLQFSWTMLAAATRSYIKHQTLCCCTVYDSTATLNVFYVRVSDIDYCRARYHGHERLNLVLLLHDFRSRSSTDPRDKIFGLLGLVNRDPHYHGIQADYSLSPETAYEQVFLHLFRESGSLNALVRPSETKRTLDLPTWMPDWTARVSESTKDIEVRIISDLRLYNACLSTRMDVRWPGTTKRLVVKGLLFDKVAALLAPHPNQDMRMKGDVAQYVQSIYDDMERRTPAYVGGGSLAHAFWRLTSLDLVDVVSDDFASATYRRTTIQDHKNYPNEFHVFAGGAPRTSYLAAFQFFISEKGYIGMGPKSMKLGDTVHVFLGGSVPFVLRQIVEPTNSSTQEPNYEFVGNCFVQGIMDGEALHGVDLDGLGYFNLV
ncbi:heterokaryon incompatibility protein-domain-containing protein [Paraphoma chrysanthemicola]|uniref:Heterokaryon incompatibility protein-domain-containing protein n=1 Tax=Paraphoma chrysanthemicola TaxID=798071 RepID=A0A8K0VW69_9PLEO|nr:heterokaryon incompatibility protein-domain-containing protein [Paraphoma chrysanthemicola]